MELKANVEVNLGEGEGAHQSGAVQPHRGAHGQMGHSHKARERRLLPRLISGALQQPAAAGVMTLELYGPPVGTFWSVRSLVLCSITDTMLITGNEFNLYASSAGLLNLSGLKLCNLSVPSNTFFSEHSCIIRYGEIPVITSGQGSNVPAGTQLVANLQVSQWCIDDVEHSPY